MRMRILWVASDAEPSRLDAVIRHLELDGRSNCLFVAFGQLSEVGAL